MDVKLHTLRWRSSSSRHTVTILALLSLLIISTLLYRNHGGNRQTFLGHSRQLAGGMKLRILPVGDSITAGVVSPDGTVGQSSDGNAWRLFLRELLISEGVASADIDFIGSKADGRNNTDNQHEGWSNQKINSVLSHLLASKSLHQHPNIILIHAGTNDMNTSPPNELSAEAYTRLGVLLDEIYCRVPEAVVVVSKIIQNDWHQDRTDAYNDLLPGLLIDRVERGYKVLLADHSAVRVGEDKTHPSDTGYLQMAENWMDVLRAIPPGWLQEPLKAGSSIKTCQTNRDYNWLEEIE